jgi:hypothetical protein
LPHKLTLKQDRFAHEYVRNGGNASAAYRTVYDCAGSSESTVNVNSWKLVADAKIAQRIDAIESSVGLTAEDIMADLNEDRDFAYQNRSPAAAISATVYKGKHIGMWPNKAEVAVSVDHSLSLEGITEDDMRELAAAARERRLALESGAIDTEYREAD